MKSHISFRKDNYLSVDEESACQRLDNFLFGKLKKIPKSRIYRMIRSGEVRVNSKRVRQFYRLVVNDLIRIPPIASNKMSSIPKVGRPNSRLANLLLGSIIFEDEKIIVINKPAGIASHGGSGINFGVIEILRDARVDLKELALVHRLDRDTSGCLILSKKRSVLRELHRLMVANKITKKYLLLVRGAWQGGMRRVELALVKDQLRSGERMVNVDEQRGKKTLTIFRPIRILTHWSLLSAELGTGRTHQIRVHAASIGYPIIGDEKYGDKKINESARQLGVKRLGLHAHSLEFAWENGEVVKFVADSEKIFTGN